MIECAEIITVINTVSTRKTNTIATNVTSTASINCQSKNVRDCSILHTVLLAIILLLTIIIICFHYAKQKGIIQNGNNEFKKFRIKNRTCYYLDDIIKLEDFDLDNILIDEQSNENIKL